MILSILLIFSMTMTAFADTHGKPVNRVEFIKALLDLRNINIEATNTSSFKDVTNPEEIPYVEAAVKQRIASGYRNSFYPADTVTKEQAVTMVLKSFGELDMTKKVPAHKAVEYTDFQDRDAISSWAKAYIAYGAKEGIIDGDKEIFNPQGPVTIKDLEDMMLKATEVFTREGLTAGDMLEKTEDKLAALKALKYNLKMTMESHVIDKSQENYEVFMTMEMLQEASMDQEKDKNHVISTTKVKTEGEEIEAVTEMVIGNHEMYVKLPETNKWMKQDINPMMKEIEVLMGTSIEGGTGISKQQIQLFGMTAAYLPEEKIDGEDYYVILFTVDKESVKAAMDEIIKKILPLTLQMKETQEITQQEEAEKRQQIEEMLKSLLSGMDLEVEYKYYINKATKELEKIEVDQTIHRVSGIVENHTTSVGTFTYFDFNEPLTLPNIKEKDVLKEFQLH